MATLWSIGSIVDDQPAILNMIAQNTTYYVEVNPDREYTIFNLNLNTAGASHGNPIYVGYGDAVVDLTGSLAADADEVVVPSLVGFVLGPGHKYVMFRQSSSTNYLAGIVPGPKHMGRF